MPHDNHHHDSDDDDDDDDRTLVADPLLDACERNDERLVRSLIEKGYRDDRNRALAVAAAKFSTKIMGWLLSCKSYADPEYKINRKNLQYSVKKTTNFNVFNPNACSTMGAMNSSFNETITFSSMFPTVPVAINWHGLGHFATIEKEWLVTAALRLNVKLRLPAAALDVSLAAITRLDLSCNNLRRLPLCVFRLQSLRTLDLSQNMIDHLPMSDVVIRSKNRMKPMGNHHSASGSMMKKSVSLSNNLTTSGGGGGRRSSSSSSSCAGDNEEGWCLPQLEELYLQDNRLESVCCALFQLPALTMLDLSNNKLRTVPPELWLSPNLRELNLALNLLHDLPRRPTNNNRMEVSPKDLGITVKGSSSIATDLSKLLLPTNKPSNQTTIAQSPIDHRSSSKPLSTHPPHLTSQATSSTTSTPPQPPLPPPLNERPPSVDSDANVRTLTMHHVNSWSGQVELLPSAYVQQEHEAANQSQLQRLNLSHNSFSQVPVWLSCTAVQLSRLNISYNCLQTMGSVKTYPVSLKHLDVSHNQISDWFTNDIPLMDADDPYSCCPSTNTNDSSSSASASLPPVTTAANASDSIPATICIHKQHYRLEQLKTLIVSHNQLTSLKLYCAYDPCLNSDDVPEVTESDFEILKHMTISNRSKPNKLLFPGLTMLDIGHNQLRELTSNVSELSNLAVLNVAHNPSICRLPAEMGLLNKLWNLNTQGCNLDEPLKSMIESKKYKTMDIIGYLKSILEDSKPYARMKLMVVGIQGIGKTTLLDLLRQEGTSSAGGRGAHGSHSGLSNAHRRRPPEHWAKRMGHKQMNIRTPRGVTLSTVGVDVYDFTYDKKVKGQKSFGPVTFRTWDFGGQKEYYATHQYFLSRRSLYLVVWRMIDGEKGIDSIHQWLVNIQARAPNSPVIIVGTFYDQLRDYFPRNFSDELQFMIRQRFINVLDHDKLGIPKVIDSIEISTKTKYNVKQLCNLIYDTVFSIQSPGSKERLLEQKIPATYLALEEIVVQLAAERRANRQDPVLRADEYRAAVLNEMNRRYRFTFRDVTELNQATSFLHENGVLLHYEDAILSDLYFLDPQWLCDLLAHVVTIREINPYARNGLMRTDDLRSLFKHIQTGNADIRSYMLNLLNKFEVALSWDSRTLLIPSLLPTEEALLATKQPASEIRIPLRSKIGLSLGHSARSLFSSLNTPSSTRSPSLVRSFTRSESKDSLQSDHHPHHPPHQNLHSPCSSETISSPPMFTVQEIKRPEHSVYRILLMTYFPCGFWSRLIVRLLADETFSEILNSYFLFPPEVTQHASALPLLTQKPEWRCWQTGIALFHYGRKVFHAKEILNSIAAREEEFDYFGKVRFLVQQENIWTDVEIEKSSILEMYMPNHALYVQGSDGFHSVVEPCIQALTKMLAIAVDHVDVLLEDWYPSLGTRFVHTSDGKFLITRIVPCIRCLNANFGSDQISSGSVGNHLPTLDTPVVVAAANATGRGSTSTSSAPQSTDNNRRGSNSREKCLIVNSNSTFNIHDILTNSSRPSTIEGSTDLVSSADSLGSISSEKNLPTVFCFMIEECILRASERRRSVRCPVHREQPLLRICPDTVFADLTEQLVYDSDVIKRSKMLGRGAFGFVFKATVQRKPNNDDKSIASIKNQLYHNDFGNDNRMEVALKTLQPVEPGNGAKHSDQAVYKASIAKWQRDPLQYSCKAYCVARKELNILMQLKHPHIVPLVGLCTAPLALLLQLAPMGALDLLLKDHRRSGSQLAPITIQKALLQVARALEYLHQQHIIYRDLKSENVLVWRFPSPDLTRSEQDPTFVDVRLADYGISRSTLPTGTKGFGGTEGFMAPEIMRYNGEQEYTEKVDCFSFGMFTYELITLRLPFEGQESVKDFILEGVRPKLTKRDAAYPSCLLDLMVRCWAQLPNARPSASQLVSIVSAPEFIHLLDVLQLHDNFAPLAADVFYRNEHLELWLGRLGKQTDVMFANSHKWQSYKNITSLAKVTVICVCVVPESGVWIGDSKALVHVYSLDGSYIEITNFALEVDTLTAVRAMKYMAALKLVIISSTSGRLWLCERDTFRLREIPLSGAPPVLCFSCTEYEFDQEIKGQEIKGDQKNSSKVNKSGKQFHRRKMNEIWCGQSEGCITTLNVTHLDEFSVDFISHYSSLEVPEHERQDVFEIITERYYAWSYLYPGSIVFQWDMRKRALIQKLDCAKLAPCSESLMSISIEEHLNPSKCQIKSMAVMEDELYIGTTLGSLIIAEASKMRPITVFRAFEEEIKLIVPVNPAKLVTFSNQTNDFEEQDLELDSKMANCVEDMRTGKRAAGHRFVITIGKGYRCLFDRYLRPTADHHQQLVLHPGLYAALWSAHDWLA